MKLLLSAIVFVFFSQIVAMNNGTLTNNSQLCESVIYKRKQRLYRANPYQANPSHDVVIEVKDEVTIDFAQKNSISELKKSCLGCLIGAFEYFTCKNTTRDN